MGPNIGTLRPNKRNKPRHLMITKTKMSSSVKPLCKEGNKKCISDQQTCLIIRYHPIQESRVRLNHCQVPSESKGSKGSWIKGKLRSRTRCPIRRRRSWSPVWGPSPTRRSGLVTDAVFLPVAQRHGTVKGRLLLVFGLGMFFYLVTRAEFWYGKNYSLFVQIFVCIKEDMLNICRPRRWNVNRNFLEFFVSFLTFVRHLESIFVCWNIFGFCLFQNSVAD